MAAAVLARVPGAEGLHGGLDGVVDVEDAVDLGDVEDDAWPGLDAGELDGAVPGLRLLEKEDERAESGAVDVGHLAEVEEDILGVLAVGEDLVLEVLGAGGDEASIQRDLEDVADDVKTVVHGQSPI